MQPQQADGSQPQKKSNLNYRPDIDGLRAVAILAVVIFHAFPEQLPGGFVGVDVFFTISGFLISSILFKAMEQRSFSFMDFYKHRANRIFPALIFVLSVSYAWGWFALSPAEFTQLGKHIAGGASFVQNFILWSEAGYFDTASESKPLMHLWSLAIEEQFYLAYPLIVWGAWRLNARAGAVIAILFGLSLSLNLHLIGIDPIQTFFSPATRIWELLAGALLAFGMSKPKQLIPQKNSARKILANDYMSAAGLLLILGSLYLTKDGEHFPGWRALFPVIGTCLMIGAGTEAWANRVVLAQKPMVFIGLISYPIYLWHWPLLSFARITETSALPTSARVAIVFTSIGLAWLTYKLIEKPIRFGKKNIWKNLALLTTLLGTTAIAYETFKLNGLPDRFPKIYSELATFKYDYKSGYREGTCFLKPLQNSAAFNNCKSPNEDYKPTLLLWGDSHAAHLYPGYQHSYATDYAIRQRTASGCPPIINMDIPARSFCREINDYILNEIKQHRPNRVVLAGIWNNYKWQNISHTIDQLRANGITEIDLIGPVPQWQDGLPKQLLLSIQKDSVIITIPKRLNHGLVQQVFDTNLEMTEFSKQLSINYVSALAILCNSQGCLTRLGDTSSSLTAWDYGHLTATASEFLVSEILKASRIKHAIGDAPVLTARKHSH